MQDILTSGGGGVKTCPLSMLRPGKQQNSWPRPAPFPNGPGGLRSVKLQMRMIYTSVFYYPRWRTGSVWRNDSAGAACFGGTWHVSCCRWKTSSHFLNREFENDGWIIMGGGGRGGQFMKNAWRLSAVGDRTRWFKTLSHTHTHTQQDFPENVSPHYCCPPAQTVTN